MHSLMASSAAVTSARFWRLKPFFCVPSESSTDSYRRDDQRLSVLPVLTQSWGPAMYCQPGRRQCHPSLEGIVSENLEASSMICLCVSYLTRWEDIGQLPAVRPYCLEPRQSETQTRLISLESCIHCFILRSRIARHLLLCLNRYSLSSLHSTQRASAFCSLKAEAQPCLAQSK